MKCSYIGKLRVKHERTYQLYIASMESLSFIFSHDRNGSQLNQKDKIYIIQSAYE